MYDYAHRSIVRLFVPHVKNPRALSARKRAFSRFGLFYPTPRSYSRERLYRVISLFFFKSFYSSFFSAIFLQTNRRLKPFCVLLFFVFFFFFFISSFLFKSEITRLRLVISLSGLRKPSQKTRLEQLLPRCFRSRGRGSIFCINLSRVIQKSNIIF